MTAAGALERVATLLAAARTPDDKAPRAFYCAEARIAFDSAKAELQRLEVNLCALEAHLLEEGALLRGRYGSACEGKAQPAPVAKAMRDK